MKLNEGQIESLQNLQEARLAASTPTQNWWESLSPARRGAICAHARAPGRSATSWLPVGHIAKINDELADAPEVGVILLLDAFSEDLSGDILVPGTLFGRDGLWRAPLWRTTNHQESLCWHGEILFFRTRRKPFSVFCLPHRNGLVHIQADSDATKAMLQLAAPTRLVWQPTDGAPKAALDFLLKFAQLERKNPTT